jgi:CheY-like chemotaxis protein
MKAKPIIILLAEDDPDDRYLIGEAIDESRLVNQLFVVENGEELLDYLYHRGRYIDTEKWPRPGLILLDLNMPRKDGREVLREIKNDPTLARIPVIVLTTSQAEEDVRGSYDWGASGFITKPVTFSGLVDVMNAIGMYWVQIVDLPPA